MSVELRWDQCCDTAGCMRPARHGALCSACFYAATPARRATELLGGAAEPDRVPHSADDYVSSEGAVWLAQLWAA
jgi:hypothetical protein